MVVRFMWPLSFPWSVRVAPAPGVHQRAGGAVLWAPDTLQVVSDLDVDDQSFLEAVLENPRRLLTVDPGNA